VFAHGWNTNEASARDLYHAMFNLLAGQVGRYASGRDVGLVAVFWPAAVFPEDDPAISAAPAVAFSDTELTAALSPAFPAHKIALARIGELLDIQPEDSQALTECHALIRSLVTPPDLGALEDTGERRRRHSARHRRSWAADRNIFRAGRAHRSVHGPVARHPQPLRIASYYEMKSRTGVIGQAGLGALLDQLAPIGQAPRHHLLGHSFGARLPAARTARASPVKSLLLIQGALSHFSFAQPVPIDLTRDGYLAPFRHRVDGSLLATHSNADRALGWWYPAASLLSRDDIKLPRRSDLPVGPRWGTTGTSNEMPSNSTFAPNRSPTPTKRRVLSTARRQRHGPRPNTTRRGPATSTIPRSPGPPSSRRSPNGRK
jgi:hypothetical protein